MLLNQDFHLFFFWHFQKEKHHLQASEAVCIQPAFQPPVLLNPKLCSICCQKPRASFTSGITKVANTGPTCCGGLIELPPFTLGWRHQAITCSTLAAAWQGGQGKAPTAMCWAQSSGSQRALCLVKWSSLTFINLSRAPWGQRCLNSGGVEPAHQASSANLFPMGCRLPQSWPNHQVSNRWTARCANIWLHSWSNKSFFLFLSSRKTQQSHWTCPGVEIYSHKVHPA